MTNYITLKSQELGTGYGTRIAVATNSFADQQLSQMHISQPNKREPTLLRYLTILATQKEILSNIDQSTMEYQLKQEEFRVARSKLNIEYNLIMEVRKCPGHLELLDFILTSLEKNKAASGNKFGIISIEKIVN